MRALEGGGGVVRENSHTRYIYIPLFRRPLYRPIVYLSTERVCSTNGPYDFIRKFSSSEKKSFKSSLILRILWWFKASSTIQYGSRQYYRYTTLRPNTFHNSIHRWKALTRPHCVCVRTRIRQRIAEFFSFIVYRFYYYYDYYWERCTKHLVMEGWRAFYLYSKTSFQLRSIEWWKMGDVYSLHTTLTFWRDKCVEIHFNSFAVDGLNCRMCQTHRISHIAWNTNAPYQYRLQTHFLQFTATLKFTWNSNCEFMARPYVECRYAAQCADMS